jgi:hypothetical protein
LPVKLVPQTSHFRLSASATKANAQIIRQAAVKRIFINKSNHQQPVKSGLETCQKKAAD